MTRRPWHRWEVYVRWTDAPDQHLGYALTRRGAERAADGMRGFKMLHPVRLVGFYVRRST